MRGGGQTNEDERRAGRMRQPCARPASALPRTPGGTPREAPPVLRPLLLARSLVCLQHVDVRHSPRAQGPKSPHTQEWEEQSC